MGWRALHSDSASGVPSQRYVQFHTMWFSSSIGTQKWPLIWGFHSRKPSAPWDALIWVQGMTKWYRRA